MSAKNLIGPSSVVLVSGGARGITAQCVIHLAQRAHCKFILLGRTAINQPLPDWARDHLDDAELKRRIMQQLKSSGDAPTPQKIQKMFRSIVTQREVEGTLEAVRKAGGQAEYVSVDITDRQALLEKLAEPEFRLGKVTGIIQARATWPISGSRKKPSRILSRYFHPRSMGWKTCCAQPPPPSWIFWCFSRRSWASLETSARQIMRLPMRC